MGAAARLRAAGIEDARAEASLLLAHALGASRTELLARPERIVDEADRARFNGLVDRRAAREPFAYIVGEREFYGRAFAVDPRVLIPRPETEVLVERALEALGGLRRRGIDRPLVVDVGTGSGAVTCTLALEARAARVVAVDASMAALAIADLNRRRLGLAERVHLVRGDLLSWLGRRVDLVVANLPYLPGPAIASLAPEIARYEPRRALDGGPDGADLLRRLLAQAPEALASGGVLLLELDPHEVDLVRRAAPWPISAVIPDLAGLARMVRFDAPR